MFTITFLSTQTGRMHKHEFACVDALGRFINYLSNILFVKDIKVIDGNGDRVWNLTEAKLAA